MNEKLSRPATSQSVRLLERHGVHYDGRVPMKEGRNVRAPLSLVSVLTQMARGRIRRQTMAKKIEAEIAEAFGRTFVKGKYS
jgi:hypothetical protein